MRAQILWIGTDSNSRDEFAPIIDELSQQHAVHFAASVATAELAPVSDLVIVALSRPGQLSGSQVEAIQSSRPDAKFVYLLSDWCCGQKRTDPEFSRLPTFYRHELQRGRVFAQLTDELAGSKIASQPTQQGGEQELVAVYARTRAYGDAIRETLTDYSSPVVQLKFGDRVPADGVGVVIWETPMSLYHREAELAEIKTRHPAARVIALVTYPRDFEIEDWNELGVSVLSQPFRETDLLWQIGKASDSDRQRSLRISA